MVGFGRLVVKVPVCHNSPMLDTASTAADRRPAFTSYLIAVACLAWLVGLPSGCYWLRYHDLLRTHVDLMEQIAEDAGAGLAAGHGVLQPADIERLRYPLERARSFAAISARRFGGEGSAPASLAEFESFIEAYAALVSDLDRLRVAEVSEVDLRRIREQVERVGTLAGRIREVVDREE
jgi:hypothetical protein